MQVGTKKNPPIFHVREGGEAVTKWEEQLWSSDLCFYIATGHGKADRLAWKDGKGKAHLI